MSGRNSAATDKAIKLVEKGWTKYAAAKKTGIAYSTLHRAIKRMKK